MTSTEHVGLCATHFTKLGGAIALTLSNISTAVEGSSTIHSGNLVLFKVMLNEFVECHFLSLDGDTLLVVKLLGYFGMFVDTSAVSIFLCVF